MNIALYSQPNSVGKAVRATLPAPVLTGPGTASGDFLIEWTSVAGATEYKVYGSATDSGYTLFDTVVGLSTTIPISQEWGWWYVVATDGVTNSPASNHIEVTLNPPAGGDPNFANRILLCPFDGVDGSTALVDVSSFGRTITPIGNAQIDTAESKWGGSSLKLDGTGDGFSLADAAELDFGTNPWAIECWIKHNTVSLKAFCDHGLTAAGGLTIQTTGAGLFQIYTSGTLRLTEASSAPNPGQWYWYQFTQDGGNLKIFRDGVAAGSVAHSISLTSALAFYFGIRGAGTFSFNGWFEDLRVSNIAAVPFLPSGPLPTS